MNLIFRISTAILNNFCKIVILEYLWVFLATMNLIISSKLILPQLSFYFWIFLKQKHFLSSNILDKKKTQMHRCPISQLFQKVDLFKILAGIIESICVMSVSLEKE